MSDVLIAVEGTLGHITLNRPKALNALTVDMVKLIDQALIDWADDASIKVVLLDGTGERGFCAGGDIRSLYESARARTGDAAYFFREEFTLNARIAEYAKPVVALMDGIVMGGGIGLGGHASHRVVTERSGLAMPEVGIGYFPDVGSTYILSTLAPGELGTHIALTAQRFSADDAITASFADRFVPSARLTEIAGALTGCESAADVSAALAGFTADAPTGAFRIARSWIDSCYTGDDVDAILARLDDRPEEAAHAAAKDIRSKSPTSLKQTLRVLRRARSFGSLRACLEQELIVATQFMALPDFVEGVRAAVVDKDRNPRWSPAQLSDLTAAELDRHFPKTIPGLKPLFAD